MHKYLFIIFFSLTICGCTSTTVRPIDPSTNLKHICIEKNPKVKVSDFTDALRDAIDKHGLTSEIFSPPAPPSCQFILTYTATRNWDFSPYLSHAEIRLEHNHKQIGYAEYHLNGGGGFSLYKWQSTKTKIDPIINELLKNI